MFTLELLDIHLQSLHDLVMPMICLIGKVFVDFRRLHKIIFVFYYILCYIKFNRIYVYITCFKLNSEGLIRQHAYH